MDNLLRPNLALRFDLPCDALGMEKPPCPLQMRFLGEGESRTLLTLVPAGKAAQCAQWVERHTGNPPIAAPGLAPRTLRCELKSIPAPWQPWMSAARVVQVDLATSGVATLFVQGTKAELASLAGKFGTDSHSWRQRPVAPQRKDSGPLTAKQLEVLRNAVTLGYYDIPHRINLRELGKTMGLSVAAVSQLLRRAQAQIIRGYIDANSLALGDRLEDEEEASREPKGA